MDNTPNIHTINTHCLHYKSEKQRIYAVLMQVVSCTNSPFENAYAGRACDPMAEAVVYWFWDDWEGGRVLRASMHISMIFQ